MAEDNLNQLLLNDPATFRALVSSLQNDASKADLLVLCADRFLMIFRITGDEEDFLQALETYKDAAACLSEDSPRIGGFLNDIAMAHYARFETSGSFDDLDKCISYIQKAVEKTAEADASLPGWLNNLANMIVRRSEHNGNVSDVSEAIRLLQRAIELTPEGHVQSPIQQNGLGNSFMRRFEKSGNLEDITEAIRHHKRAVELTPNDHPNLPSFLSNLGASLMRRYECKGDMRDISETIRLQQRAVELTPNEHQDLPGRLSNLGAALACRFERTQDMRDISDAIEHHNRAIQLTPDKHPGLPSRLNNLGNALASRFECNGDLEDISKAIGFQKRAVELAPDGHDRLSMWLNNLGGSQISRFDHMGDTQDISEAIRNFQHSVLLTPTGDPEAPARLSNLGNSLSVRYERSGDPQDISEAIQHLLLAVQATPDDHSSLPTWLNNLAVTFLRRFGRVGDIQDTSEAIQHQKRAIQLTPEGHGNLPTQFNNLGISYFMKFEHTEDTEDISMAIQNQQRAVDLTPNGHAKLPSLLNNLGGSFARRFELCEETEDISLAIQHLKRAIQLTPDGYSELPIFFTSLGNSYLSQFLQSTSEETHDVCEAITCHERAIQLTPPGHVYMPGRYFHLGIAFLRRFERTKSQEDLVSAATNFRLSATSAFGSSSIRLTAAKKWVECLSKLLSPSPSEILEAHSCIIELLSLISGLESTVQHRHEVLVDASQLPLAAAAAALSLGNPERALEWLVEGRCIVWNQINQLRTPLNELRSYDSKLSERLTLLSRQLEIAGLRDDLRLIKTGSPVDDKISFENEARTHLKLAKDWEALITEIRNISQFKSFLRPMACTDIMRDLPKEGPVVFLNVHKDRCDAIALNAGASKPIHIPLPDFSHQDAKNILKGLSGQLLSLNIRSRLGVSLHQENDADIRTDFPTVLKVLWMNVVFPILEALTLSAHNPNSDATLPRIWWCPTGPLAFLPIHAAGVYEQGKGMPGQCLGDFAISSYIPTINSPDVRKSDKQRGDGDNITFLIVSQPQTPDRPPIPFAKQETEKIQHQLEIRKIPTCTLNDENGTIKRVLESMEKYSCIHLACHASQQVIALKSSIYLHDGSIELSNIMEKNLRNCQFAFLSACQTSKGDAKLSEEVVHLASGMLAAGYRSVVGTMWAVLDKQSSDLAEYFYETLLDEKTNKELKINGSLTARALHGATKRLRDSASGSPQSFLAWVPYIHFGI